MSQATATHTTSKYGAPVATDNMIPCVYPGDTVWMDQDDRPRRGDLVVFYSHGDNLNLLATLVRQTRDFWIVKLWNPESELELAKIRWPIAHRVVETWRGAP
jgi:phage repressor protein C with HTH and peptisase S24 domain